MSDSEITELFNYFLIKRDKENQENESAYGFKDANLDMFILENAFEKYFVAEDSVAQFINPKF